MNVIDSINARKSIRKYEEKPVSENDLRLVLEAGVLAPSARNLQNWKFIAVTNKETNLKLRSACNNQQMVGNAPVSIIVCANDDSLMGCGQSRASVDCSIALSFMILRATELGLSTCWLGSFKEDEVKKLLEIPEEYRVVAVTPLGYAAEEGRKRNRKSFDEVVMFEKFK